MNKARQSPSGWSNRSHPSRAQKRSAPSLYAKQSTITVPQRKDLHHPRTDSAPARSGGHLDQLNLHALHADHRHVCVVLDVYILVKLDPSHLDNPCQDLNEHGSLT